MSDPRYDKHYHKLACKVLQDCKHISDFAYHGTDPDDNPITLGNQWGFTISTNRDSDLLTESNWDVISSDMLRRFPRSVVIDHIRDYAYGWVEFLTVRMLDSRDRLTMAGIAILEWNKRLARYPVANEDDYSRREYESYSESMEESTRWILRRDPDTRIVDNPPDGWIDTLIMAWRDQYPAEYDRAWDHEGWIDDREGVASVHLVELAESLGFVEELI